MEKRGTISRKQNHKIQSEQAHNLARDVEAQEQPARAMELQGLQQTLTHILIISHQPILASKTIFINPSPKHMVGRS